MVLTQTGNTSVGKSCLAHYYENHTFEDREKTIGLEFVMKHVNINDKSCMIQLWDTVRVNYKCSNNIGW